VRVIAGEFRGRRLKAPPGRATRPTSDRVREALFSILGDVSGNRVLDLFAGSGALGIEALSRGAGEAVFVESGRRAADALRANLRAVGDPPARVHVEPDQLEHVVRVLVRWRELRSQDLEGRAARDATVETEDALKWLARARETYDLVFADPPYSSAGTRLGDQLSALLPGILHETSVTVTESDKRAPLALDLPLVDERTYGDTRIAIHRGR